MNIRFTNTQRIIYNLKKPEKNHSRIGRKKTLMNINQSNSLNRKKIISQKKNIQNLEKIQLVGYVHLYI